jgi:hypothetical protein
VKQEETMKHYRKIFAAPAILIVAGVLCPPAHGGTLGTDVIGMFPQNVAEFAYADLRQARALPWFPQLKKQMLPPRFQQFEQFLTTAGINPDSQVEELAWGLVPGGLPPGAAASSTAVPTSEEIVGVALGSFRPETAEAFFKAQKLPVVKVRDFSLYPFGGGGGSGDLYFVFIDANTAAFGQRAQLEKMISVRYGEEPSLYSNTELSNTFAALLMAGLLYKRFQAGNSNPDLAAMLDGMRIAPAGDTLQLSMSLTNDQVVGLIRHNTFGTGL